MIISCEFCEHFEYTGQTAFGTTYNHGGRCTNQKCKKTYCNGYADACNLFYCGIAGAKKIENHVNRIIAEQRN